MTSLSPSHPITPSVEKDSCQTFPLGFTVTLSNTSFHSYPKTIDNNQMASIFGRPFRASLQLCSSSNRICFANLTRSNSTDQHRPLMLMDLPLVASPNLLLMAKNFFSRIVINGYFDSTFAIQPFCQGARQALTVVSHLIGNDQFDDLPGFVTREVNALFEQSRQWTALT